MYVYVYTSYFTVRSLRRKITSSLSYFPKEQNEEIELDEMLNLSMPLHQDFYLKYSFSSLIWS